MNMLSKFQPVKTDVAAVESGLSDSGFLPYIKIADSSSKEVAEEGMQAGHWVLGHDGSSEDLGPEIVAIVLAARFCAKDFDEDITEYDPSSEAAGQIRAKADRPGLTGAVYGPEFLFYLNGRFITYHMNNKSGRRAAPSLLSLCRRENDIIPTPVTMKSKFVKYTPKGGKREYSFYVPVFKLYQGELSEYDVSEDEYSRVLDTFLNPPKQEPESEPVEDKG